VPALPHVLRKVAHVLQHPQRQEEAREGYRVLKRAVETAHAVAVQKDQPKQRDAHETSAQKTQEVQSLAELGFCGRRNPAVVPCQAKKKGTWG